MARYIFVPPASRELLDRIASGLPDYFPRADVGKWTNGLFSAGYLENLAVEGRGPETCFIGKKCVITKEAFMEWVERTYYKEKQMTTLKEMVVCLKDLRQNRKNLEDRVEAIKTAEKDLCDRILMEMAAQGLKSLNIEGVARIAARDTYRYEFADIEKFAQAMFNNMLAAVHDGHPLVDALLLQQRMSKSNFEDMLTHQHPEGADAETLDQYGVRKIEERTLSLTKA